MQEPEKDPIPSASTALEPQPKKRGRPRKYQQQPVEPNSNPDSETVTVLADLRGVDIATIDEIEALNLTPKEVAFLKEYQIHLSAPKAARAIGLTSPSSPGRYLRREGVRKALEILGRQDRKVFVSQGVARVALDVLREIAVGDSIPPGIRVQAAKDLLDRAGIVQPKEITINHTETTKDRDSILSEFASYYQQALDFSEKTDQQSNLRLVSEKTG